MGPIVHILADETALPFVKILSCAQPRTSVWTKYLKLVWDRFNDLDLVREKFCSSKSVS